MFGFFRKKETLSDQVRDRCKSAGWPEAAADTAAKTAVEICGGDDAVDAKTLHEVLSETCRID